MTTADATAGNRVRAERGRWAERILARRLTATVAVYAGMAGFSAALSVANALRYASFTSARFDLGNMTQAVWSTAHGRFLELTTADGQQVGRYGIHVDPILAAFAVPWRIWPSPLLLTTALAVAVSLGALPVFWLARKYLASEWIAAAFAFAYLLYPATLWNAHFDFHPVSLAIPLLLFAIWYLEEDRLLMFLPFALAAAATKEHMPLIVGWLGVWYAVRRGRRLVGASVAGVGLVGFVVSAFVVLPHFAPAGVDLFSERYSTFGGSPGAMAQSLLTNPGPALQELTSRGDLAYLVVLVAPLAGLCLLSPLLAAGALPELALDLLSAKPEQTQIMYQYSAAIAPFFVAASVLGAARLRPEQQRRWSRVVLGISLALLLFSPARFVPDYLAELRSTAHEARAAAIAMVPPDAPVSATNQLGGHLSARERILVLPETSGAEWVVADVNDPTMGATAAERAPFLGAVNRLRTDPRWEEAFSRSGIVVFRRRRDGS